MISVAEAREKVLSLVAPLGSETVPLSLAAGRVLAEPVRARRTQPPFPASAMDGYAVENAAVRPGAVFEVIGEAAAGRGFGGTLGKGAAVRIFTGAPVPPGADRVIIQEDVERRGDTITLARDLDTQTYIRPAGTDFAQDDSFDPARPLRPSDIALLAAMGHGNVDVMRRPEVAIIATGDELVMPGETPGPDQIVASNNFGLKAMVDAAGGHGRILPIARDTESSLAAVFDLARGADLVITIGGASVGDHDLVARVAETRGLERAFYKVAMRPGKPLMAGRMDGAAMIGLPGNPVSSMVCGLVFVRPALRVMLGLAPDADVQREAPLAAALPANGPRAHYMRAMMEPAGLRAHERQDSALLTVLAGADALIIRPAHDRARAIGERVPYLAL
ncbi:molybdopterin molybdotransferase MoeA [Profundibacterium mesophilum]|uniref:Molybdopterin molybdenumtransferase n=1 Tax=Profundibacterium mesophilum KAUST100406-0324 TaxID=1037889 RepID=A0A921NQM2_9RHOB|nr:gephyrin-like molybdotransferase Glp [Profundibacterium mesophilum]KAF0675665.1 Molybdopterin biosynthesis protein [Profundibacterium mesophilum KAUST100406-0324]